jgi:GLPGLI family protein
MKKVGSKILIVLALLCGTEVSAQIITEGRIVFERRTNLEKRFANDQRVKRWMGDNKSKIDEFELIFNDTISMFRPVESDVPDRMSWATSKSVVRQNFVTNEKILVLDVVGQKIHVRDTNDVREWKVTDSKRKIGKYNCRKAVYQKDDTTRLYAWYAVDVVPSVGPEGFHGLPGAILGLATEDGGIIYFAKEVKAEKIPAKEFEIDLKRKDVYSLPELKAELEKRFAGESWGARIYTDLFRWL